MHKDTEKEIIELIRSQSIMVIDTVAVLRSMTGNTTGLVFLKGSASLADGRGGMYYWDATATDADDTVYLNTVVASGVATGRWKRLNQRVTVLKDAQGVPTGAILVANAGVKTLYATLTVTGTEGEASFYCTPDASANTAPIMNEIWENAAAPMPAAVRPTGGFLLEDSLTASALIEPADRKLLTYSVRRGNKSTLGGTLLLIIGTVIPSLRYAPAGTQIRVSITGI